MSSIRFLFTPRSLFPRRDAERKWIIEVSEGNTNSTSSTNRQMRDVNVAYKYRSDLAMILVRGISAITETSLAMALS
jgi:hypothetical protein